MIKRLIILLFLLIGKVTAQSQSIELPDFIITGSKSVSLPELKKPIPEVIGNISPENFDIRLEKGDVPSPHLMKPELLLNLQDTLSKFNSGKIEIASGYYVQPEGDFIYSTGIEHILFNIHLFGKNIADYEKYSRFNTSGIDGKLNFFISPKSIILPGTKFNFNGKYVKQEYRLFGSDSPSRIRKNDISGTLLSFENSYSNNLNYSLIFHADKLEMKSDTLQNIEMKIEPNFIIKFSGFKLYSSAEITTNKVYSNNSDYNSYQKYFSFVELNPMRNTIIKLGGEFSHFANSNYPKVYFEISYKMLNQFLFGAKFKPFVKYNNHFDFLKMNPYYIPSEVNYTVENHKLFSEFTFGYNLEDVLQISSAVSFDHIDSLIFIDDYQKVNELKIGTVSDIWQIAANLNVTLKTKILGNFYSHSVWQSFYNKVKYYMPGYPDLSIDFINDLPLSNSFSIISSVKYNDGIYFNLMNNKKSPSQLNVSITGNYLLTSKFNLFLKLENLINKNYYDYENYRHKPLDIIAGFEYQW